MTIYTFQPQSLVEAVNEKGFVIVEIDKTNIYRQLQAGGNQQAYDAYYWMAGKLAQKTGLWLKSFYGDGLDAPKDADGDYLDDNGEKIPVLPFWGWYMTDGKCCRPDSGYAFDTGDERNTFDWNKNTDKTKLLTLEIPEKYVLLSDINAWYCALEGRPCFEYEDEATEIRLLREYNRRAEQFAKMKDGPEKLKAAEVLYQETVSSWDNMFRLEGRRLKEYMGIPEKHDIQAVFPAIDKRMIVSVDDVR